MTSERENHMELNELTAITTLDGRYRGETAELSPFVSEFTLIKTRVAVEAKYLVALSNIGVVRELTPDEDARLLSFGDDISLEDAQKIKELEETNQHDVKAMERIFRDMLAGSSLSDIVEKVHIGLTSEDINNIAYRLMLRRGTEQAVLPRLQEIVLEITSWADTHKATPMLARTHGQAAVPTTVGKEMAVFANRLDGEIMNLQERTLTGKFSGAVGNFNALRITYPEIDWEEFAADFVASFGLTPSMATTQINTYEDMASYFDNFARINRILIDFDQDVWRYISDHWIAQKPVQGERGSSTMPQKVNPIRFENSEGNLGLANALFEHFSRKLPISRLQRDLSDSTVIRNIGTALGYSLVAYKSLLKGMGRIHLDQDTVSAALNEDWSILGEAVQTILREAGVADPYTLISDRTRGKKIAPEDWQEWVDGLPIDDKQKELIRGLTPETYIGDAVILTEQVVEKVRSHFHK